MVVNDRRLLILGFQGVFESKDTPTKGISDSHFLILALDDDANEYYNIINWSKTITCTPPHLVNIFIEIHT